MYAMHNLASTSLIHRARLNAFDDTLAQSAELGDKPCYIQEDDVTLSCP